MAFFMNPGAMFLGCLGTSEQKFLVKLIETAAKSGYTRFVEPCAGTFAMSNLAVQNGYKLTYEAELVEGRNEHQTMVEWLRREIKWQESRAKTTK